VAGSGGRRDSADGSTPGRVVLIAVLVLEVVLLIVHPWWTGWATLALAAVGTVAIVLVLRPAVRRQERRDRRSDARRTESRRDTEQRREQARRAAARRTHARTQPHGAARRPAAKRGGRAR
jgi:membrane protein implicated in regulation of membrane protease activity